MALQNYVECSNFNEQLNLFVNTSNLVAVVSYPGNRRAVAQATDHSDHFTPFFQPQAVNLAVDISQAHARATFACVLTVIC